MASKKIIAICQSGGEFITNNEDGSLTYVGGEAYALDLDDQTLLNDFKQEVAENFECRADGMTIKYFLPGNKKTLITISKDKDLKRMINFFKDSEQVEMFIIAEEGVARSSPNVTVSRYLLLFRFSLVCFFFFSSLHLSHLECFLESYHAKFLFVQIVVDFLHRGVRDSLRTPRLIPRDTFHRIKQLYPARLE